MAQYAVIRNYWAAVKIVFAEEWAEPKKYLLLKNIGVWSLSLLGGTIINRCLAQGRAHTSDLVRYLEQTRPRYDWSSDAPAGDRSVTGMSGNRAANLIASAMAAELSDDSGVHVMRALQDELISDPT
jgi:hypothetical protein